MDTLSGWQNRFLANLDWLLSCRSSQTLLGTIARFPAVQLLDVSCLGGVGEPNCLALQAQFAGPNFSSVLAASDTLSNMLQDQQSENCPHFRAEVTDLQIKASDTLPNALQDLPTSPEDCAHFRAEVTDLQILTVSSLGGVMESGCLALQAQGVTLTGARDRGCLLYCPAEGPSCSSASSPAIEFWQVSR